MPKKRKHWYGDRRTVLLLSRSAIHLYAWEYLAIKRSFPGIRDSQIDFVRVDPKSDRQLLGMCIDKQADLVFVSYEDPAIKYVKRAIDRGIPVGAVNAEGKLTTLAIGSTQGKSHLIINEEEKPAKRSTKHRRSNPGSMGLDADDGGRNDL